MQRTLWWIQIWPALGLSIPLLVAFRVLGARCRRLVSACGKDTPNAVEPHLTLKASAGSNDQGAKSAGAREAEASSSHLEPFDDGFVPSTCTTPTNVVRQPALARLPRALTVIQKALDPELAIQLYRFSLEHGEPWGTYAEFEGVDAGELKLKMRGAEPEIDMLAQAALRSLWARGAGKWLEGDLKHVHGFSVWAVVGGVKSSTAYHVDYAEVYRRNTNIIRPPLHAITLQVRVLETALRT